MEAHLFQAIANNNLNGIRALMNMGVPLTIRSAENGETPLSHAMRYHAYDAARLLLALGLNPNDANGDGSTPLHYATQAGRADMVDALMCKGADPRTPDMNGVTPLQVAQMRGDQRLTEQLNYSRFDDSDIHPTDYATYMRRPH
jgi:ankyrin repeat protein